MFLPSTASITVKNGEFVIGSATNATRRAYIFLNHGCTADGYVKHVNEFRRIGAIKDWRNHDDRQRNRRRLLQSFPKICVVAHNLAGYDLLRDDVNDEPIQFSAVHKFADVVDLLHTRLRLPFWENIMVCRR